MLEVKLKEIVEKNTPKRDGFIQHWIEPMGERIITVHLRQDILRVYYVDNGGGNWIATNIDDFVKVFINDICYEECNENWEKYENELHVKNIETLEELTDVKFWKSPEGHLYMSNWNLYEHVPAMLTYLDNDGNVTEIYENVEALRKRMKHLNLYKVSDIRLEEL